MVLVVLNLTHHFGTITAATILESMATAAGASLAADEMMRKGVLAIQGFFPWSRPKEQVSPEPELGPEVEGPPIDYDRAYSEDDE